MPLFTGAATGPSATVIARTPLPADVALAAVSDYPIDVMFTGWGPFPRVTGTEGQTGAWDRAGLRRTVLLSDGGRTTETVVEWTEGHSLAYELVGFTDVFGRMMRGVRGEWSAAPDGGQTVLRWTWEFAPRPGWRPFVALVIAPLWRIYMARMVRVTIPRLAEGARAR